MPSLAASQPKAPPVLTLDTDTDSQNTSKFYPGYLNSNQTGTFGSRADLEYLGALGTARNTDRSKASSETSVLTASSIEAFNSSVSHQKTLKIVCEWFVTWRPWQQKTLLCGITNRCSMQQLEALATTLEPVFHRDFVVALRRKYPTTVFKKRPSTRNFNQTQKASSKRSKSQLSSKLSKRPLGCSSSENIDLEKTSTVKSSHQGQVPKVRSDTSFHDVPQKTPSISQSEGSVEVYVDSLLNSCFKDAIHSVCSNNKQTLDHKTDILGNIISRPSATPTSALSVPIKSSQGPRLAASLAQSLEGILRAGRDSRMSSQHHNAWSSHKAPSLAPNSRPPSRHQSGISRSLDSAGLHRTHIHRPGTAISVGKIHSVDFFIRDSFAKMGHMQAELRTGAVFRPHHIQDINIPLQRLYKNAKWFPSQPSQGHMFVRPHKSSLARQYQRQLVQVWQWVSEWEDHESLGLLVDIIKLCTPDIQNYLAQCLYHRLRERIDINWLPDQVLLVVLSNLNLEDIINAEQVCRRWKYLCSVDELWQYKCQQFGEMEGIPDLLSLIRQTPQEEETIDWRLAFLELRRITDQARRDVRVPTALAMKGTLSPAKIIHKDDGLLFPMAPAPLGGRESQASKLAIESSRLKQGLAPLLYKRKWGVHVEKVEAFDPNEDPKQEKRKKGKSNNEPSSREVLDSGAESGQLTSGLGNHGDLGGGFESSMATEDLPSIGSAESIGSRGTGSAAKPLLEFMRGRKRREEDLEEMALDVRMQLTQARDLLGKSMSQVSLHWKTEDRERGTLRSAGGRIIKERLAGSVQPVRRVRNLTGHMDAVLCVEVDERRLISGSMDRSIRIWDVRSGRSVHKLYGHKGAVSCLKFDNDTLFSGSWDMAIMVWDLVSFNRRCVLTGHSGTISCLQIADDYMLSGSHDGTIRVWGRSTHVCIRVLRGHSSHVLCMHYDGTHVFSGSSDRTIRQTHVKTGQCVKVFTGSTQPVHKIAVRGQLALTCTTQGQVYFWDLEEGRHEAAIQAHEAAIHALAFHRGHFYTAGSDNVVKEWDLASMTCVRSLVGHKAVIRDFKVNDRRMVSCSADGHIRVWDLFVPVMHLGHMGDDILTHQIIHQRDLISQ